MSNLPDLFESSLFSSWRNRNLQRQIDRLLADREFLSDLDASKMALNPPAFTPSCNVEETDTHFLMSFDLPGVRKENIKVAIQDNVLNVSGERKEERQEKRRNRTRSESFFGSFERSFTLPAAVDAAKVEATYSDGVLKLAVPKPGTVKSTQVKIGDGIPSAWKSIQIQERQTV